MDGKKYQPPARHRNAHWQRHASTATCTLKIKYMKIEIIVDNNIRTFADNYEALHVINWNEIVRESLDRAHAYEEANEELNKTNF